MRHATLFLGLACIGLVVILALFGVLWTPFDPTAISDDLLLPPGWPHVLGTDGFGADVLSRIMSGARICLLVGVLSVTGAAVVGVPLGVSAGMTPFFSAVTAVTEKIETCSSLVMNSTNLTAASRLAGSSQAFLVM